ncbi:MAG: pyridoxamine 5'-phosphate oxidase family protein [Deltaproteobacteria bacterium]|jgi:uncharacterized pyridoxamine 5'-phosphate oxidase family protein|nr:pyridoxamine 5'-phosphate oxidase family protein [Deltaproteobacteria bacterium]
MKDVFAFLAANRPFYLATIKDRGPKVRPMGFVMEYHGKIYFGAGAQKQVYRQMVDNPLVEIATTDKDGQWLRLTGLVVFDDDPECFEAAVQAMPRLKEIYPEGGPRLALFYLKDGVALFHDHQGNVLKTVNF